MPHSPLKVPGRAPAVPGFNSEVATVGAIRIHYWIGGEQSGSPILLWHGFLGTGYMWRHVMTALAEAGFAVLVPDMRGYGDSDKPPGTKGYDGRAPGEEFRARVHQMIEEFTAEWISTPSARIPGTIAAVERKLLVIKKAAVRLEAPLARSVATRWADHPTDVAPGASPAGGWPV